MVSKEVIDKVAQFMTAAFGLVAALAWNQVIQSLFQQGGPFEFLSSSGPWAYAIIVTIIAVIASIWIGRAAKAAENRSAKRRR